MHLSFLSSVLVHTVEYNHGDIAGGLHIIKVNIDCNT